MYEADYRYVERLVKFLLWAVGGYRIYICGNSKIASELQKEYRCDGRRSFDWNTMREIYEHDLVVCRKVNMMLAAKKYF